MCLYTAVVTPVLTPVVIPAVTPVVTLNLLHKLLVNEDFDCFEYEGVGRGWHEPPVGGTVLSPKMCEYEFGLPDWNSVEENKLAKAGVHSGRL